MDEDEELYSLILSEDLEKGEQVRFTIKTFRGQEWLHLRKYYLGFEGEWLPTKAGISTLYSITTSLNLLIAVVDVLSLQESKEVLQSALEKLENEHSLK